MKQTPRQIFLRFLRFGLLAWGGPVAQIGMLRKELVEEEQWVSKEQFNRALAVYQALPGPEAHELCVYFGMRAGGRWGGFLAGFAFMLPGFLLMLLCTWFYVTTGIHSPLVQTLFGGVQAAVIALIVFAVYRIGKHAVTAPGLLVIAIVSALAFFSGVSFWIILLAAGAAHASLRKKKYLPVALVALALVIFSVMSLPKNFVPFHTTQNEKITVPVREPASQWSVLATGLKAGLLTFGGAYTAIPFVQQDAVISKRWMTQEQFLDGIAISGILPAPLIIFTTFAGFFGGGWGGALLITAAVFLPAFLFTLIGHTWLEKLIATPSLHDFLDGVTAGVVGLIGITAAQLFVQTIHGASAIVIFLLALAALIKFRSKYTVILIISGAALINLLWHYPQA